MSTIRTVAVFGSSSPQPGDPTYALAYRLGRLLGQRGLTVLTGGYIGTMEAVSKGVVEAGGHSVGVTCEEIERWRPVAPNPWVQEEWRAATLIDRLRLLITRAEAALALPGGPGTLTEVALFWNHLVIQAIPPRPLVLIGAGWRHTFEAFFAAQGAFVPQAQRAWLRFAADETEALAHLGLG